MSRIPGTALHDDDPPEPTIERATRTIDSLRQQLRFYESVMAHQGPHHQRDRPCKIAEANGLACCNPKCNGNWGTGCWCCHALSFAQDAETAQIVAHLALAPAKTRAKEEESEAFKRQASVALAAIEGLLARFPETEIELYQVEDRRSATRDREADRGRQGDHPRAVATSSGMALIPRRVIPDV